MTSHHDHVTDSTMVPGGSAESGHCERCGQDLSFIAYVIGASVLVGAILVSASIFYNFNHLYQHIDDNAASLAKHIDDGTASMAEAVKSSGVAQGTGVPAPTAITAPTTAPTGPVKITLAPNTPFLGSATAKVTVVEFADYQCPFCEQFYTNTWPQLRDKYVTTGKIKFVYQDFAFLGADSNTAAEAAHCAQDQNKFWQYHDYLFSHQGTENTGWATADHQKEFAAAVGLDTAKFNQCLDSHQFATEVTKETAAGKSYGVSGTPTVFVNGNILVGAEPLTSFEQAIDAALAK